MGPAEFRVALWQYLSEGPTAYKENWTSWPGRNGMFESEESSHGDFIKLYANKIAAFQPLDLPMSSIIVQENYDEEERLIAITVMYRAEGYDPPDNDWYWTKYLPDGRVARTSPEEGSKPIAGRWEACVKCHRQAEDNDLVFANDYMEEE